MTGITVTRTTREMRTPAQVIANGRALVQGCRDGGVLPVMKHMPGHGLGTLDSHLDLPRVDAPHPHEHVHHGLPSPAP